MFLKFLQKYKIKDKELAVGVSGGADSLALVLQMHEELSHNGYKIIALTVNHGLRDEADAEAQYVAEVMLKAGMEHHILVWQGNKPTTGIEEAARNARYHLLCGWCHERKIQNLVMAHHLFDQAETFLMRLQRGSGLDGLCGMQPVSENDGIKILRPLLNVQPEKMKDYLIAKKITWVEDASNQNEEYLRVKARKFLPELDENLGITAKRIVETMILLTETRNFMEEVTQNFIKSEVFFYDKSGCSFHLLSLKKQNQTMIYRVLNRLLKKIGRRPYSAESDELTRLRQNIFKPEFKGCTLADCEIIRAYEQIWIVPEQKSRLVIPKKSWEEYLELHPQYKKIKIPHKMRLSLMKSDTI